MGKKHRNKAPKTINQTPKQPRINALVDVVWPVYGQYPSLIKSMYSVEVAAQGIPYKAYLVDDCSKDYAEVGENFYREVKQLAYFGGVQIHKQNQGYGKTVNDAAILGTSKYILVMTTDVYLTEGSLKIMVDHLENNPQLGIIAPKLLFPPDSKDPQRPANKIQHIGIVYNIMLQPYHLCSGWDDGHPITQQVRDVNSVTGACFLIRRNLWQHLKGFSLEYGKGTFEDLDLCLRTAMLGMGIRVLPQAVGFHQANLSVIAAGEGYPMDRNARIFAAKFEGIIPYDDWLHCGLYNNE
jgi:O-antigen biosynthesis protein